MEAIEMHTVKASDKQIMIDQTIGEIFSDRDIPQDSIARRVTVNSVDNEDFEHYFLDFGTPEQERLLSISKTVHHNGENLFYYFYL